MVGRFAFDAGWNLLKLSNWATGVLCVVWVVGVLVEFFTKNTLVTSASSWVLGYVSVPAILGWTALIGLTGLAFSFDSSRTYRTWGFIVFAVCIGAIGWRIASILS